MRTVYGVDMKTADLTQYPSAEYFTVQVHNFKDDPERENASLHGLFTDASIAATVASVIEQSWSGFIRATVVPIRIGTVEQVAATQAISHIAPDLPAGVEQMIEGVADESAYHDGHEGDGRTSETQRPAVTEESLRQEFLDLSAEIGAAGERRCTYVYPNGSVCNKKDHLHHWNEHAFQDDLTEKFAAHVARHETFLAEQATERPEVQATENATERDPVADAIALAEVVHEADWMMAGPRWPWYQATGAQREDALLIAQNAIADPTMDDDALVALVERLWSTKPKHGAPRRVVAKVRKIREWLISEGLRESIDTPSGRS